MSDSIYDKLAHVSAAEIAEALTGQEVLTPEQRAAADLNADGRIDAADIELAAKVQLDLANKISGAIVGMAPLTDEEKLAAERNGDGHINLTDSHRLADDSRAARRMAAEIKRKGTGPLA